MSGPSLRKWGAVQSTAIARDLLFEDERAERLRMPHADRWVQLDQFAKGGTVLELDVGSVLGFSNIWQEAMADRIRAALEEVGRICKEEWQWNTGERAIKEPVMLSTLTGKEIAPEADKIINAPTDYRKFIMFNFASRNDAMLARMTIVDLRSVRHDDGGGLPQAT